METIKLFIKSALIDNVVFIQYLAICPFIGMTNDTEKATGMGLATTFVIMLATAVTWPLYKLVMLPLGLEFLQTLFFILVIASLVQVSVANVSAQDYIKTNSIINPDHGIRHQGER